MVNNKIRKAMKMKGVYVWQVADLLGTSESNLYKKFRHELPPEEQERILKLIEEHYGKEK